MVLFMSATNSVGFLIEYTLLSIKEGEEVYGQNVKPYFLNMDRQQWKKYSK